MEFIEYKLEEISDKIGDGIHGTPIYDEKGKYYFINGNNLKNGKIDIKSDTKKVNEKEYLKHKRDLNKNTLLISINGTLGNIGTYNNEKCILGKSACYVNIKEPFNMQYIKYVFMSKEFQKYLIDYANGTTIKNVPLSAIRNYKIKIPNIIFQNKIVKILKNLDKKIEMNNQINDNLQEQLQIYFEEKINKYKNKELPDGWKIMKLKDISIFSQGVQVPIEQQVEKIDEEHKVRFIRIVDITQRNDKDIRYIEDKQRGYVEENDIFMIRYGTPGTLSRNYKGIIANNLFKITPKDFVTSEYLFSALNSSEIQGYIKQNATSSTMPAISFGTLNDQEIIVADKITVDEFSKYSDLIRRKQLNLIKENEILGELRDTLLPKLMNGEIDLNKIEI